MLHRKGRRLATTGALASLVIAALLLVTGSITVLIEIVLVLRLLLVPGTRRTTASSRSSAPCPAGSR